MYPVDLHMHTFASTHAYSTLSDYIAEAKRKGIKLFAITDHGPDMEDAPHHWHLLTCASGRVWLTAWGYCVALRRISRTLTVKLIVPERCSTRWI